MGSATRTEFYGLVIEAMGYCDEPDRLKVREAFWAELSGSQNADTESEDELDSVEPETMALELNGESGAFELRVER